MFKKGDKLDIFDDEYTEQWLVCTIAECKDDSIKINYDGYDDQYAEWIPIISKRIAPYNTHTLNYQECELPPNLSFGYPPPLYWHDDYHNKGYVIISSIATDDYIYAFDTSLKIFIKYCQYPSKRNNVNPDQDNDSIDFDPIWHSAVIDQTNDKLYILTGTNSDYAILDLPTKQWSFNERVKDEIPLMVLGKALYIPNMDELHVYADGGDETHFKVNKNDMLNPVQIIPGIDDNKIFRDSIFIYCEKTERLYMFGGWNGIFLDCVCYDKIWYCDVKKGRVNTYEWKLYPLKMPHKEKHFAGVLGFGFLFFVFYIRNDLDKSIWCLDLTQDSCEDKEWRPKWYNAMKTNWNHIKFFN